MTLQLRRLRLTGLPALWIDAGFASDERSEIRIGSTTIELVEDDEQVGVVNLHLDGLRLTNGNDGIDGLPFRTADTTSPDSTSPDTTQIVHPNGVIAIDHIVAMTPDLDRTGAALDTAGFDLRRRRDAERDGRAVHQLFYWLGDVILEVVADPRLDPGAPARFWGLALTVDDLDATAALLGPLMSAPREAVQRGRRIASLKRDAGLSVPIAFMTPHVASR